MSKISGLILVQISLVFCTILNADDIVPGASQPDKYLPLLENKRVGLVINNTSMVGEIHLVDFLLSKNLRIEKIFAPEHGFRGDASAGEEIKDGIDMKTGIKIISLYGQTKKPTDVHLKNIDILLFDIQNVGCRFYIYISTLHLVIKPLPENIIQLFFRYRPIKIVINIEDPVLQ